MTDSTLKHNDLTEFQQKLTQLVVVDPVLVVVVVVVVVVWYLLLGNSSLKKVVNVKSLPPSSVTTFATKSSCICNNSPRKGVIYHKKTRTGR